MSQLSSAKNAWILLGIFYIASLCLLWPGVISPDALSQYEAAVMGIYSDHHPPVMSFLWHYLDLIYPGPGLLFALHLTLLYASAAIFIFIFRDSKFKWWYAVYPLIPNMLAYTVFIVKDAGFVYCYLLAGAIISYLLVKRPQKFKWWLLALCCLLLFYGTAVKFQARYLLIFFTLAIGYCWDYRFSLKTILAGILLCAALLLAMFGMNSYLVPNVQKSHSWQFVKLYDLTAMSLQLDTPLYPEFIQQDPNYNFAKIKQVFDPQKVDDLVFPADAPLHIGRNETERDLLWDAWFQAVKQHPWLYLQVRLRLWSYNLISMPSEYNEPTKFLAHTALKPLVALPWMEKFINSTYVLINAALKYIWLLPLTLLYAYLGIKNFQRSPYAAPLALFNLVSIALLGILLFFSMAGVARYVLLCTCLVHASHGFAYRAFKVGETPITC